jgi:hypothetical protein
MLAVLAVSCSGPPEEPGEAVSRMIEAYGGSDNIPALTSYTGLGFAKRLSAGNVATSYPLDIHQKRYFFKSKIYRLKQGEVTNILIRVINDEEQLMWSIKEGFTRSVSWKPETIRYRFPLVLEWLPSSGVVLEPVESVEEGLYGFKFEDEGHKVTMMLDDESWLLRKMNLISEDDTIMVFREEYGDYMKVDGTWFPTRYTGYISRRKVYEYLIPVVELDADLPDDFFVLTESDTTVSISKEEKQ